MISWMNVMENKPWMNFNNYIAHTESDNENENYFCSNLLICLFALSALSAPRYKGWLNCNNLSTKSQIYRYSNQKWI